MIDAWAQAALRSNKRKSLDDIIPEAQRAMIPSRLTPDTPTYDTPGMIVNYGSGLHDAVRGLTSLLGAGVTDLLGEGRAASRRGTYDSSLDDVFQELPSQAVSDYKQRYGSGLDEFLLNAYEDPTSYLFDIADATGIGMGVSKGARALAPRARQVLGDESGHARFIFDDAGGNARPNPDRPNEQLPDVEVPQRQRTREVVTSTDDLIARMLRAEYDNEYAQVARELEADYPDAVNDPWMREWTDTGAGAYIGAPDDPEELWEMLLTDPNLPTHHPPMMDAIRLDKQNPYSMVFSPERVNKNRQWGHLTLMGQREGEWAEMMDESFVPDIDNVRGQSGHILEFLRNLGDIGTADAGTLAKAAGALAAGGVTAYALSQMDRNSLMEVLGGVGLGAILPRGARALRMLGLPPGEDLARLAEDVTTQYPNAIDFKKAMDPLSEASLAKVGSTRGLEYHGTPASSLRGDPATGGNYPVSERVEGAIEPGWSTQMGFFTSPRLETARQYADGGYGTMYYAAPSPDAPSGDYLNLDAEADRDFWMPLMQDFNVDHLYPKGHQMWTAENERMVPSVTRAIEAQMVGGNPDPWDTYSNYSTHRDASEQLAQHMANEYDIVGLERPFSEHRVYQKDPWIDVAHPYTIYDSLAKYLDEYAQQQFGPGSLTSALERLRGKLQ